MQKPNSNGIRSQARTKTETHLELAVTLLFSIPGLVTVSHL